MRLCAVCLRRISKIWHGKSRCSPVPKAMRNGWNSSRLHIIWTRIFSPDTFRGSVRRWQGHFGDSWFYTVPVLEKFNDCIWLSFVMGAISLVFEVLIAIPLGIVAATKQYSRTDYTISVIALAGISLPTFFFASLLKLLFSVKLGWFESFRTYRKRLLSAQHGGAVLRQSESPCSADSNACCCQRRKPYEIYPHEYA